MVLKMIDIKEIVKSDLDELENDLLDVLSDDNLGVELRKILSAPAKRLRPLICFLFLRGKFKTISQRQRNIILALELIHNATLIHDDIIDKADYRRSEQTINSKFDDNLAVISGDFLLSCAMEKIISVGSIEVLGIFVDALKRTCMGEMEQYFSKFCIPSIEDYVKKSRDKTALLFKIGLQACLAAEACDDKELVISAEKFGENFGIAFQIRDDLLNIMTTAQDVKDGIYTAPVIFATEENEKILDEPDVFAALKKTQGIEKTKDLMDNYFEKAFDAVVFLEDNEYKQGISNLVEELKEDIYDR